jgi:sulfofructose kinase
MSGLIPARVLCFGIVVADRVFELDALPAGEGKYTARAYRETGGGIAGTAAVAIAALGGHALFAGALGDDAAGGFLRAEMAALGVDLAGLQVLAGARTPSAAVLVDAAGERCLVVDRGSVTPSAPASALCAGAGAILIDHRHPEPAAALLATLPAGVPSVFDGEGGDAGALRRLAGLASHPVFSRNGLRLATGEADAAAGLRAVVAPRAAAIGVTLGAEGSLWRIGTALHHVPAVAVAVRDTTGCGDVFHGALALALAEGVAVLPAARFASAAAAAKAARGDGWRGMPDRDMVRGMM